MFGIKKLKARLLRLEQEWAESIMYKGKTDAHRELLRDLRERVTPVEKQIEELAKAIGLLYDHLGLELKEQPEQLVVKEKEDEEEVSS